MNTHTIAVKVVLYEPALLSHAVDVLYRTEPDPCGLLNKEEFTLRELQTLHEQVLGETLTKDAFRRRMVRSGLLEPTGDVTMGAIGKPAQFYRKVTS